MHFTKPKGPNLGPSFLWSFLRLLVPHIEAMHLPGLLPRYRHSNVPKILLFQSIFWSLMSPALSETCYWPNGDTAKLYVACPDSKVCCRTGEACLSNGMCYGTKLNIAYRGACSDKSWPIAECPRVCYTEIPYQWANLYSCPNATTDVFTCGTAGWATDVCNEKVGEWKWESANITAVQIGVSSSASPSVSILPPSTNSTGTTTSAIEPSHTTSSSSPDASNTTNTMAIALGAGLGAGLGLPLLIVSGCLLYLCVQTRRQARGVERYEKGTSIKASHHHHAVEIATQPHNMASELEGTKGGRSELYG